MNSGLPEEGGEGGEPLNQKQKKPIACSVSFQQRHVEPNLGWKGLWGSVACGLGDCTL